MQKESSSAHGIKWGLIIGVIYCILLSLRYVLGSTNTILFGLLTVTGYIVVLILLLLCGLNYRKKNGGYVEMKEAFKTMFIAVLIFEFLFAVFTFIYLKYIDPNFFDKLRLSTENLLLAAKQSQSDTDKVLKDMDSLAERSKHLGIFDFLKTYLSYVGITGMFALIYAFIIKRKPPFFQQETIQ